MYLLLTDYGSEGFHIKKATTLDELRSLYNDSDAPPHALILAKELTLKICEPDDSTATDI